MSTTLTRPPRVPAGVDPDSVAYWTDLSTGRQEIRSARTSDGVWELERHDDRGTTWTVTHLPTGRVLRDEVSLRKALHGIACGWVLAELDRRDHAAVRPVCLHLSVFTGKLAGCLHTPEPGTDRCRLHPLALSA